MAADADKPLNIRQQRFVELVVSGMPAGRAYEAAGFSARGNAAEVNAARLLRKAQIVSAVETLRSSDAKKASLDRAEAIQILGDIIRSKPSDATMDNPLCEVRMSKAGPFAAFPDKARCLERLAKMLGWDEPEKHQLDVNVVIGGNAESHDQN